jgi:hypothetical protein
MAGLVAWPSFYFMDRFWYHLLLKGAVNHTVHIENSIKNRLPSIALSTAIGEASPILIRGNQIRSSTKINYFYLIIASMLIVTLIAMKSPIQVDPEEGSVKVIYAIGQTKTKKFKSSTQAAKSKAVDNKDFNVVP